MKYLFVIVFSVINFLFGQIQVTVSTDKQSYLRGDTILITITAYNSTIDTATLEFFTTCQTNYYIDDFEYMKSVAGCFQALTRRKINPLSSFSWPQYRYPSPNSSLPILSLGQHKIVGEVLGRDKSDTVVITVAEPTSVSKIGKAPSQFSLDQNYPNPFNPTTNISFTLPSKSFVSLKIFDALGREVSTLVNEELLAGNQTRQWRAENVSSGIYFYQLKAGSFTETKKLLLLR